MQRAFRLFAVFALAVSMLALTSTAHAATPTACNGIPATITGTPGDDTIPGTPGDDVILGLGGADVIDGGGGNDIICGGSGDDTITGGDGNDVAYGAAGNDDLAGGNGEDDLFGGPGDDTLRGNQDDDNLVGGAGNDLLNGGYGNDIMRGNDGDDRGFGGPGTDYAEGGPGADSLSGADDDDDLRGNGGDDMLSGEGGDDLLYGGADSDTADGGIGFDRCMSTEFPIDCEDDDLNDPPVAMDDEFNTDEDQATGGILLADNGNGEDYDPNGHPLAVVAVDGDENEVGQPLTLPSGAEIMVGADGSFTYDPNGMYEYLNVGSFALDTFEYTISDPKGETNTATVAMLVDGVNDAPVAEDDEAATNEDESVAIDVLLNDTDVDSSISIADVTDPASGSVAEIDGELVYTPNENTFGPDSFTYTITDGELESTATVTVNVGPINDLPIAEDDLEIETDEDTPVGIDVLDNDSDVEDDAADLTITIVDEPENGSVTLDEGGVEYTPDPDYNGLDSFTYEVTDTDGGTSAETAMVEIEVLPVNDAPIAEDDDFHFGEHEYTGFDEEDDFFEGSLFDDNGNGPDSDIDGDELRVVAVNGQPMNEDEEFAWYEGELLVGYFAVEDDGFLFFVSMLSDGFLPVGSSVSDAFEYTISDGEETSTATVTITIHGENDDPFANDDGPFQTNEETAATFSGLTGNDYDPDLGDRLFVSAARALEETEGSVMVNPDGSVTYDPVGGLDFVPEGEVFQDVFEYTVSDDHGGTATALVSVDVLGINDAPVAVDDTPTIEEDTTIDIDVLANDTDVDDGAILEVIALEFGGTQGTVAIVGNQVRYIPPADFFGEDTFEYTMRDEHGVESSAMVTVTINSVNDDPVADDDEAETDEDTPVTIDVTANDSDVEDDSSDLAPVIIEGKWDGSAEVVDGEIRYTPPADFWGEQWIPYYVEDTDGGTSNEATVHITVNPVNDAPEAVDDLGYEGPEDEPLPIPVLNNDFDVDGDPFWIIDVTEPGHGWVDWGDDDLAATAIDIPPGFGDLTYFPNPNYFGPDTFEYMIQDPSGATSTATVTVEISPVNDRPITEPDLGVETEEDTPVTIDVTANDFDVEDPPANLSPALKGEPMFGTAAVVEGQVVFTPAEDFNGQGAGFWYAAVDSEGAESLLAQWVDVLVTPVNDAPNAEPDDGVETLEDESVVIWVTENDSDVDGDFFWISDVEQPANGFVEWGEGPGLREVQNGFEGEPVFYTPDLNYFGPDSFTYTITDGLLESTATVSINVVSVNDLPEAFDDLDNVTDEDTPISIDVTDNDFDVEDLPDALTPILGEDGPRNGEVAVVEGEIVYTPNPDFYGQDSFWYYVEDTDGGVSDWDAEVLVDVLPVNDDPVAVDDEAATNEDQSVTIFVLENDSPPEGDFEDSISIAGWTDPANGTVTLADAPLVTIEAIGAQELVYTPDPNYFGPDQFEYTIIDQLGAEATAIVYLSVLPVNDLPEAFNDEAETDEDTPVTIDVTGNDTDVEDNPADLTITMLTDPANGSAALVAGGVQYTPNPDYYGSDSFTYKVVDTDDGTSAEAATVTITVHPVNDDPVAKDDSGEGFRMRSDESSFVTASVLDNDYDVDDTGLSVVGVDVDGTTGTVIPGPDGTFLYENTGGLGEGDTDSWLYRVIDGNGGEAWAEVTISINWMPVADDDVIAAFEDDGEVTGSLLDNDSDADDDELTVTPIDQTLSGVDELTDTEYTIGQILVDEAGDYVLFLDEGLNFLPDGHVVADVFTYEVSDGFGGTDTAEVLVVVTGTDDMNAADDSFDEVVFDLLVPLGNVLDNDLGDGLTVIEVNDSPLIVVETIQVLDDFGFPVGWIDVWDDGGVYFLPDELFFDHAFVSFTYRAENMWGGTDTAEVTIDLWGGGPA